jgi:hypothetical protein
VTADDGDPYETLYRDLNPIVTADADPFVFFTEKRGIKEWVWRSRATTAYQSPNTPEGEHCGE